jgi:hypothetical protein
LVAKAGRRRAPVDASAKDDEQQREQRRRDFCKVAHAATRPPLPLRAAKASKQQSTSAPGLPLK